MRRLLPSLLLAVACGPRAVADPNTGLTGVIVAEGSLAGTWAQAVETHTLVPVPVLGDRQGGGRSTRLVMRSWEPASRQYRDTFRRCTNEIFPVEGVETVVRDETLAKISPASYPVVVTHEQGHFLAADTVDLWGVKDLPDPIETALPTKDNFEAAPQSDWVWDEDEDGQPGVTIYERGVISAKLYVIKRSVWTFEGTVITPDRVQGLVEQKKGESNSLGSTVGWLKGEGSSKADPSVLSWFDMTRLNAGDGCEAVAAAVERGELATQKPF